MTRAVILAAGQGTRLRPYTNDKPKCLVPLAGKPLLQHQLDTLKACGISDIAIVAGYRRDQLAPFGVRLFINERYDSTNMVVSSLCAEPWLDGSEDIIFTYGDIVYEPRVLQAILECEAPFATTVDTRWEALWRLRQEDPLNDAETLKLSTDGIIVELGKKPSSLKDIQGQYMGIFKIGSSLQQTYMSTYQSLDEARRYDGKDKDNMFMTSYLQWLIDTGHPLKAVMVESGWLEVDTVEDLERYETMHRTDELQAFWSPAAA